MMTTSRTHIEWSGGERVGLDLMLDSILVWYQSLDFNTSLYFRSWSLIVVLACYYIFFLKILNGLQNSCLQFGACGLGRGKECSCRLGRGCSSLTSGSFGAEVVSRADRSE